jgi:hypothetical protein
MKKSLQFNSIQATPPPPESKHRLLFFRLREQEPHLSNKINFPSRKHQTSPFHPNEALNFSSTAPTELEYRQTNKQTKAFFPPKQSISLAAQFFMCCARKRGVRSRIKQLCSRRGPNQTNTAAHERPTNHPINSSTAILSSARVQRRKSLS